MVRGWLKSSVIFFGAILFSLNSWNHLYSQEIKENARQAQLAKILEATGDYCERLKNLALYFICQENIKEKTYEFRKTFILGRLAGGLNPVEDLKVDRTEKKSYVYDYQMIKKGPDLKEKRILLEENGKKTNEEDVELKTLRMSAKYLVFGPVGFLGRFWQPHFRYEILGTEKIDRRSAIVIKASPNEVTAENYCFGRIWIDEKDSSILRIEWEPESIANYKETVASPIGDLKRKIAWTVMYGIVKNGIRFPSAQSIREVFVTMSGKEHIKYEAEYVYDRYKFFTVETDVQIK
jgi:hypothetical protein